MAPAIRKDLNQHYYNEGIAWRKQTDDADELVKVAQQIGISEDKNAQISFEYGFLDEGLRQTMAHLADAFINADLNAVEILEVLVTLSSVVTKIIVAILAKRMTGWM